MVNMILSHQIFIIRKAITTIETIVDLVDLAILVTYNIQLNDGDNNRRKKHQDIVLQKCRSNVLEDLWWMRAKRKTVLY